MRLIKTSIIGAAVVSAVALPGAAQAAVTVGSNLNGDGADNAPGYCPTESTCTGTNLSLPAASTAADGLTSPIDGVIVSFAVKSGSSGNPVTLRVLRPAGGASYTGAGSGATGTTEAGAAPQFSAQTPVKAGDSIGLDIANSALVWAVTPTANGLVWGSAGGFPNGLADGSTGTGAAQGDRELLVQARIEPDADADGLGDETQDPCPTQPGPACKSDDPGPGTDPDPDPGADPDETPPAITKAKAKPKKFFVARRDDAIGVDRKGRRRGTILSYMLSEPATMTFAIQRAKQGRKRGGSCRKKTRSNRKAKKCVRYVGVGRFTQAGAQGANTRPFAGRIGGKALRAGKYRAVLVAVDGAGNESKPARVKFKVRKRKTK